MEKLYVKRGDIWRAALAETPGCVIHGNRPVIIVTNDTANRYSTLVTVIPLTSTDKRLLPCHVRISGFGLRNASIALTEQVVTISKERLLCKIGSLSDSPEMRLIERALRRQIDVA